MAKECQMQGEKPHTKKAWTGQQKIAVKSNISDILWDYLGPKLKD